MTTKSGPQVLIYSGTRPTEKGEHCGHHQGTAISRDDHDHHDERPHACNDGWITLGQLVVDPETGEESEEFALYLCRKCAERS
jgi:hypothetical protein